MFAFNFGIESLQQSVKLDLLLRQFPSLNTTFSKPKTENRKAVLFTVLSLLELLFSYCCCGGERKPIQNAGHCFARKFSA